MGVKQYIEEMVYDATVLYATSTISTLLWGEEEMPQSLQKAIREERKAKVTKRKKIEKAKEIQ